MHGDGLKWRQSDIAILTNKKFLLTQLQRGIFGSVANMGSIVLRWNLEIGIHDGLPFYLIA
jgi:hypothetical protein